MGSFCTKKPQITETIVVSQKLNKVNEMSKTTNYRSKFQFVSILGNGSFGQVRLYRSKEMKDKLYAIKTLKKAGISETAYNRLIDEVSILSRLDHPNIVKYYETFEDNYYVHIVMEYLSGDNLLKFISEKQYDDDYDECNISKIMRNLFKALVFIHNQNIVHRDIKPENILFGVKEDISTLKLIDFGLATTTLKKDSNRVGSPYFMAPEIINGEFTTKTDSWSVGVLLHLMLTGKYPFGCPTDRPKDIFNMIVYEPFNSQYLKSSQCSEEVTDLVTKLLVKTQRKRISAHEALTHKWISRFSRTRNSVKISEETIKSLKEFSHKTALQKEILFFIAKITHEEQVKQLRELFNRFDSNNTGTLKVEEIKNVLKQIGLNISEDEMQKIWKGLVFHNETEINYTEFLAATISSLSFTKEEDIWSAFKYFEETDKNNIGFVSFDSVLAATKAFNLKVNETALKKAFNDLTTENKKINFNEFKALIELK